MRASRPARRPRPAARPRRPARSTPRSRGSRPASRPAGSTSPASRSPRRRPSSSRAARRARPADLGPGRGPALPADDEEGQARVRHQRDRQARLLRRRAAARRARRPARHRAGIAARVAGRSSPASPARSTSRRATRRSASRCATSSARKLADRPRAQRQGRCARDRAGARRPGPASSRSSARRARSVKPRVDRADLRARYGTVVTIDRATFKLRLFKRLKFSKSYGVAVGQPAYPTPTGLFSITNKQVNPAWTAPNSPWAGELAGTTTPGGSAANPLKARWMGIANGVGIHGTGAGLVDRQPRLARLHPHARGGRDRPLSARAGRHPGADPLGAARSLQPATRRRSGRAMRRCA